MKGKKWGIGADGYFALKSEVDMAQIRFKLTGNSFTSDFTNVQGEGYYIKYDMSFHMEPSIRNCQQQEISGCDLRCLWTMAWAPAHIRVWWWANGYHFTIKIHKENENGDSEWRCFSEVIHSSGVKVGERLLQTAMVMEALEDFWRISIR